MRSAAGEQDAGSADGGGGNVIRIHLCDSGSLYTRKDFVRESSVHDIPAGWSGEVAEWEDWGDDRAGQNQIAGKKRLRAWRVLINRPAMSAFGQTGH